MSDLEKNIETLVATKVLKDIHNIVEEESTKEKKEKNFGLISVGLIVFVVLILSVYLIMKV